MSMTPASSSKSSSSSSESSAGSSEILSRDLWCASTSSSIHSSCPPPRLALEALLGVLPRAISTAAVCTSRARCVGWSARGLGNAPRKERRRWREPPKKVSWGRRRSEADPRNFKVCRRSKRVSDFLTGAHTKTRRRLSPRHRRAARHRSLAPPKAVECATVVSELTPRAASRDREADRRVSPPLPRAWRCARGRARESPIRCAPSAPPLARVSVWSCRRRC